jgi:hypothetical protein
MKTNRFQFTWVLNIGAFKFTVLKGVALLAVLWLLSACLPFLVRRDAEDIDAIYTRSANTVVAEFTQRAGATAVAELTSQAILLTAESPTPTQPITLPETRAERATIIPTPTDTPPAPSPTPLPPTATPTAIPCNQAQLIEDLTVPPETILPTGARFNKIWRVRNTGICAWTLDYSLVFVGGDRMGDISTFSLSRAVNPGEVADLTAVLTVPDITGIYQGAWMLRDPSGIMFGVGADGTIPFQVRVRAIQAASWQQGSYDFAANYCAATWRSRIAPLTCPGLSQDENGAAILLSQPTLETGLTDQYGLWTIPDRNSTGQITGFYPPYTVRDYDRFRARIGCLGGSPNCDVIFQLQFQTPNGAITDLGSWREIYDGLMTDIDIDLYLLSGKSGSFILRVDNVGDPGAANAVWLAPRIQNVAPGTSLVLTWIRQGRQESACDDELQIYLSAPGTGEARATYCDDGDLMLVNGPLNADELAQLLIWIQRLDDFQAEVYRASPVNPLISWIEFKGMGNETAHDQDIQTVESYAAQVFTRMTGAP